MANSDSNTLSCLAARNTQAQAIVSGVNRTNTFVRRLSFMLFLRISQSYITWAQYVHEHTLTRPFVPGKLDPGEDPTFEGT